MNKATEKLIPVRDVKGDLYFVNPENISTINILNDKTVINFNTTINIIKSHSGTSKKEVPAFIYTMEDEWSSIVNIKELLKNEDSFLYPTQKYETYHSIVNLKNVIYISPIDSENRLCFYFNHNMYNTYNNSLETYVVFRTYNTSDEYETAVGEL